MDEVAARASGVYQFDSKEALFLAIVEQMTNAGSDRVRTPMREPANIEDVADPLVAATQFNWLIMGEPVNRAMFFGDGEPMEAAPTSIAHRGGPSRVPGRV